MPEKKFSKKKMELVLDVKEDFGIRSPIPPGLKQGLGEAAVEAIKARTRDDKKSVHGKNFKQYTKKYADKKGVRRDEVDLTLSEDMLDSMTVKSVSGSKITLAFDDPFQDPIAFNHNTGDTLPKRLFFDLQKKELKAITAGLKSEIDNERRKEEDELKREEESRAEENKQIGIIADLITKGFEFG